MKTGRVTGGIGVCKSPAEISAESVHCPVQTLLWRKCRYQMFYTFRAIANQQVFRARLVNIIAGIIVQYPVLVRLGYSVNKSKIRSCTQVKIVSLVF